MKNICFLTYQNPLCGGTDKICVVLANELSIKYKVYILGVYGKNKSFFSLSNNVALKILHPIASKHSFLRIFTRKPSNKIIKLRKFLTKNNIDIIIDVDTGLTELSSPACEGLNIRHISWDHYSYKFLEKDGLRQRAFDINSGYKNEVVVLTKEYYDYYLNSNKYDSSNLTVIGNPVTIDFKNNKSQLHSHKVLAVGRYHKQKAYDKLIKAWSLIEDKIDDWELHIYGRDQDNTLDKLIALKDKLDIKKLFFHKEDSKIEEKYLNSDIFVLTSEYEGQPLVIMEACSAGLPIVCFDCLSGVSDVLENGKNGYLIEQGNYKMFADKLLSLVKDGKMRESFGNASFEISKKFDKKDFVNAWINFLEQ